MVDVRIIHLSLLYFHPGLMHSISSWNVKCNVSLFCVEGGGVNKEGQGRLREREIGG